MIVFLKDKSNESEDVTIKHSDSEMMTSKDTKSKGKYKSAPTPNHKIYLTLKSTPLEMASQSLSFLPIEDSLEAEKYQNRFLLMAAINYLEKLDKVEATINVNGGHAQILNSIKIDKIAKTVNQLLFAGIDGLDTVEKLFEIIPKVGQLFQNAKKITFKENNVSTFYWFFYFKTDEFINSISRLIEKCQDLRIIELQYSDVSILNEENYKNGVKRLLTKLKSIANINMKSTRTSAHFELISK